MGHQRGWGLNANWMGQSGNNVHIAISGVFLQMYKRLFKEFFTEEFRSQKK